MKRNIISILFGIMVLSEDTKAQTWAPLGSGLNASSAAIATYNGELYAGGSFTTAGDIPADRIAKWNGTSWSAVGGGINGAVTELRIYNGELYVGGTFTIAGGVAANNIAKWNGTSWSAVGPGVNGNILGSAIYNGELYICGGFTTAGGITANRVAKWNGTTWSAVGTGTNALVFGLAVHNGELYAGGAFTLAGDVPVNRIAKWNGTNWSAVGSGMNSNIFDALVSYNGEIYAGGLFTTAGGNPASRIAKWNGTEWLALGTGITGTNVRGLSVSNGELIVGGSFTSAGGVPANNIAMWNATNWSAMGLGMNNAVIGMAEYNGDLYASGDFTIAGGVSANRIAKWIPPCHITTSDGADENLIFGYGPVQCKTKIAIITNGTPPYTYSWALDRELLPGESLTGSSTASVTVCLVDTAQLNLTVTDSRSCAATDDAMIFVNDVRCFAGNNQKVIICHKGNTICVDENAVPAHLAHGDYLGPCIETVSKPIHSINNEENTQASFNIYPNPAANQVTLRSNDHNLLGSISIFDMSGRMIYRKFVGSSQTTIDVKSFSAGVYYLRSDRAQAVLKFIKQF